MNPSYRDRSGEEAELCENWVTGLFIQLRTFAQAQDK